MLHGVKINGVDTLTQYGLCMLAEYTISSPKLRENRITIPGRDGTLDVSTAITGRPVYDDRQITFTLFRGVKDSELDTLRRQLMALYHGRECKVVFPFDINHIFSGVLQFGDMANYNSGKIPVTMTANPYRLKTAVTSSSTTVNTTYKTIAVSNEGMPSIPTITCTRTATVKFGEKEYTIPANTPHREPEITFAAGSNTLQAKTTSGTGTITIEYQEGCL